MDFSPQKIMMRNKTVKGNIFKQDQKLTREMEVGLNLKVLLQKGLSKQENKEKLALQRKEDHEKLKKEFEDAHKNVLFPKYEFDERLKIMREVSKPPATLYMELGHN